MSCVVSIPPYIRAVSVHYCDVEWHYSECDRSVSCESAFIFVTLIFPVLKKKTSAIHISNFLLSIAHFIICEIVPKYTTTTSFFHLCANTQLRYFSRCIERWYALITVYTLHFVHVGVSLLIVYEGVSGVAR